MVTRLALLLALACIGVSGCTVSPPKDTYVGDTSLGSATKLPGSWQRYDSTAVSLSPVAAFGVALPTGLQVVAFSSPGQNTTDLFTASDKPSGWLLRRSLSPGEDATDALRNSVYPIGVGLVDGSVIIVGGPTPITRDGLTGETITYDVIARSGSIRVRIAGVSDRKTGRLYVLAVGCDVACHTDSSSAVDAIYANWRILDETQS